MLEVLRQIIDLGTIFSNILGGVITLLIAVYISRWEFNRREREKKKNWYRTVHNICIRARGGEGTDHRTLDDQKIRSYHHSYTAISDQLQRLLAEAPTEDVDLPLFNALQNIDLSAIRYASEVETHDTSKLYLQNRHNDIVTFCRIAQYLIEEKKSPNIELLETLTDENRKKAEAEYEKFSDGEWP